MTKANTRKFFRIFAVAAIVSVGILAIAAATNPAAKDYISYWSAAKLLLRHQDPYSPTAVLALENAQRASLPRPLIMRNPPWSLFLAVPLGFCNPLIGLLFWLLAGTGCIVISVRLLDVPPNDRLLIFLFAPVLACFTTGQSSPFLLLGFCLFLYFHQRRPFLAGASLLLMAIKPHLFLVFWLLLLIDCAYRRRFLVISGLTAALGAATVVTICFDPQVWPQYFAMARAAKLDREFVPTVSTLLRVLINSRSDWIQFVPSCLALLWGCWYYVRYRSEWNWRKHGMLVMLVSILASPYSWFPDEAVLLPCLLLAFNSPRKGKYAVPILMAINCLLLLMLLIIHIPLTSGAYLWTPVAWLTWFLYATFRPQHAERSVPPSDREDVQYA